MATFCESKNCSEQGTCNGCTLLYDDGVIDDQFTLFNIDRIDAKIARLENAIEDLPYTDIIGL